MLGFGFPSKLSCVLLALGATVLQAPREPDESPWRCHAQSALDGEATRGPATGPLAAFCLVHPAFRGSAFPSQGSTGLSCRTLSRIPQG